MSILNRRKYNICNVSKQKGEKYEKNQLNEQKDFLLAIKKSIYQSVLEATQNHLGKIAFDVRTSVDSYAVGTTITYGEYLSEINKIARASSAFNVKPNEIVPIILPNIVEARTLIYGHNIIGATIYPISPLAPEKYSKSRFIRKDYMY